MSPAPFRLLGPDHLGALALVAAVCAFAVWRAGSVTSPWRAALRFLLAAVLAGYFGAGFLRLRAAGAPWPEYLPLHLCDLTVLLCIWALLRRGPLAFELGYFWGLTGAVAALLTPDLRLGFPSAGFLHFFVGHGVLVLAIAWLAAAEGLRPRKGSLVRLLLATNGYILLVGALDFVLGLNYGYLRQKPAHATLFDLLGPWPWYLVAAECLAFVVFSLLYLPWQLAGRKRSRTDGGIPAEALPAEEIPTV